MAVFYSCVFFSLCLSLLIVGFHLFLWNRDYSGGENIRVWSSAFECGFMGYRFVENYFSFTYFFLLVFFVVFDLEVSLLLNLPFQGLLFKNGVYYVMFLSFLCLGFTVEVIKGYVVWSY
uniref:NADH-ubiquinone oxidoreductase chain 3 n=1 Tax=Tamerlania zarudnyi TaxID=138578 RepID=A0A894JKD1_9TREM|nr:NADH dehydrogenase subunit 3 [Tamerlania zarudnyi]QRV61246.1 NADH dehydrogenase subunit 3 [Tamerlania zarudnyi]